VTRTARAIQALIIASALLGVALLWEIHSIVPPEVFDIIAFGWVLFVIDSALTFLRPRVSYYVGLVLALLALGASLPQSAHWAFIQNGLLVPSVIFVSGSVVQVLIIVFVVSYLVKEGRTAD
jgi:hypothetical protein